MAALPEVDDKNREVNKQEAVSMLTPDIVALQARGYTLEQIAERLRKGGIQISAKTLKTYLNRAKTRGRGKTTGRRKAPADQVQGEEHAAPVRESMPEAAPEIGAAPEGGTVGDKRDDKPGASFVPRPDTDDI